MRKPPKNVRKPTPFNQSQVSVYRTDHVKGRWRDEVYKKGPDGKPVLVESTDWSDNAIVATLPKLLAGLMANEPSFSGGILFHAIGRGDSAWDQLSAPPTPTFEQAQLFEEFFRKAPSSIAFLGPNGQATPELTNRLLIRTDLDFEEANGPNDEGETIREHALFGGTATGTLGSGLMVDVFNRRPRFKDPSTKLTFFIELLF